MTLDGMSADAVEEAINRHWTYAEFYFAQVLIGERTVQEAREDLESLLTKEANGTLPPPARIIGSAPPTPRPGEEER